MSESITVLLLKKDKWEKVNTHIEGQKVVLEYIYTINKLGGLVSAISNKLCNKEARKWFNRIESIQTLGDSVQFFINEVPKEDIPIQIFIDRGNMSYKKIREVKRITWED